MHFVYSNEELEYIFYENPTLLRCLFINQLHIFNAMNWCVAQRLVELFFHTMGVRNFEIPIYNIVAVDTDFSVAFSLFREMVDKRKMIQNEKAKRRTLFSYPTFVGHTYGYEFPLKCWK